MTAVSDPTRLWLFYLIVAGAVFLMAWSLVSIGYHQGRREERQRSDVRARRAYRHGVIDGRKQAEHGR